MQLIIFGRKFFILSDYNIEINYEYQEKIEYPFKKLEFVSLLSMIELMLTIVCNIFIEYIIGSMVFTTI